jgi:hypothetical protein
MRRLLQREIPMILRLSEEQRQAVDQNHGFLEIDEGDAGYVVMSRHVFRDMMGVGPDAAYLASLEAIREGFADVEAGRTQSVDEFFREMDRKHGLQG